MTDAPNRPATADGLARPPRPSALDCVSVALRYGDHPVLHDISISVAPGETVALLGPSGSGKTSLLYAIAGFLPVEDGAIWIAGRLVAGGGTNLPPERRDIGFVFQHYALWPHLSAIETVAYPLRRRRLAADAARRRAAELLELMGVGALADRRASELSGGEQQRVGVARALAREASLLLLDEPTAHLDTPLRAALMAEVADQRLRSGAAAVSATHDLGEALAVADRVAILQDGRCAQVGTPTEIYERPVDLATARLSGPVSVLDGVVAGSEGPPADAPVAGATIRIGSVATVVPLGATPRIGARLRLLVRPDWASLGGERSGAVTAVWFRGPHTDYRLETEGGTLAIRELGAPRAQPGDRVSWTLHRAWLLDDAAADIGERGANAPDPPVGGLLAGE